LKKEENRPDKNRRGGGRITVMPKNGCSKVCGQGTESCGDNNKERGRKKKSNYETEASVRTQQMGGGSTPISSKAFPKKKKKRGVAEGDRRLGKRLQKTGEIAELQHG